MVSKKKDLDEALRSEGEKISPTSDPHPDPELYRSPGDRYPPTQDSEDDDDESAPSTAPSSSTSQSDSTGQSVAGKAPNVPDPVSDFVRSVFLRWSEREKLEFKAGVNMFERAKQFMLPYYTDRFASDDAFNELSEDVRTPVVVSQITYADGGDNGIDVEVRGTETDAAGTAVTDALKLVRKDGSLRVASHSRDRTG